MVNIGLAKGRGSLQLRSWFMKTIEEHLQSNVLAFTFGLKADCHAPCLSFINFCDSHIGGSQ